MRVVAAGYYHGSMEGVTTPFDAGEEREVPEATALYLLATFPGLFSVAEVKAAEVVEPPAVVAAVISAPALDRQQKSPSRRK